MCLLGLMADAEAWSEFSDRWRAARDTRPKIASMHMVEAARLGGQFYGWSPEERDAKVRRMLSVLNDTATIGFFALIDAYAWTHSVTPLTSTAKTRAGQLLRYQADPYFLGFASILFAIARHLKLSRHQERVEIIFDDSRISGTRARQFYPAILELMDADERARMPAEPLFRADDEFMPLQAADMLAWPLRRAAEGGSSDFGWIHEELTNIGWSVLSPVFGVHDIGKMILKSVSEPIPQDLHERMNRALGLSDKTPNGPLLTP